MEVTRILSTANGSGCHLQVVKSTDSAVLRSLSGFVSQVIIYFGNLYLMNKIQLDFLLRNRKFILKNNGLYKVKNAVPVNFFPMRCPRYQITSACILGMQVTPWISEMKISHCVALAALRSAELLCSSSLINKLL